MNRVRIALLATAVLGGVLVAGGASAMPAFDTSAGGVAANVETVRWVCGPFRCGWQPNYEPPFYGYGWRRHPDGWRGHHFDRDGLRERRFDHDWHGRHM